MTKNKQIKVQDSDIEINKDYQGLLQDVKSILNKGLYSAYKAVDNLKVQTYWQIGERIVREELKHKNKADYGEYIIKRLVVDLNFSRPELYKILKFYRYYGIVLTVSRQLSWSHYVELLNVDTDKNRLFYQNKAVQHSWSVRELRKQIRNRLYEKTLTQEIEKTFQKNLPAVQNAEVFKNDYDFNFLDFKTGDKEKLLENLIVSNIEAFLKELGEDFAFIGRQIPIKINEQAHFIDLVLYHKAIPCNILVDLKIGKIDGKDVGQMNKYVNYYRHNRQYEHEKDTIGLIICQEAGKEEIFYAIGGLEQKIFIATYKAKLPSEKQIKNAMKKLK
jgi:predicted nuclease of restriction endonuclease-like (RecB) superfamily